MWLSGVLAVVLGTTVVTAQQARPFTVKPIEEVVREMGYEIERHNITTSDGYILTYHRLPRGRIMDQGNELPQTRKVLLFINGIFLSSASTLGDRRDFAYQFADAGFDVWLGNYRGNTYARRHRFLNPDRDNLFWDYSLHELGVEDLTAGIDYILGVTGAPRLLYVGVSMGTTMFFVLGAARPQYMDKVEAMVAVAPVARTSHMALLGTPVRYETAQAALTAVEALGFREIFPYREALSSVTYAACTQFWALRLMCIRMLRVYQFISGDDWDNDRVIESMKYHPSGISAKVLRHYAQIAKARTFQQFDYGPVENRRRYQADVPPEYDLRNVNCSEIYFINSDADQIAAKEDVAWLSDRLPKRPTRILADSVNHLGHVGLGLDKRAIDILVKPLTAFLRQRYLASLQP